MRSTEERRGPREVRTWFRKNAEAQGFRPVGPKVSPSSVAGKQSCVTVVTVAQPLLMIVCLFVPDTANCCVTQPLIHSL